MFVKFTVLSALLLLLLLQLLTTVKAHQSLLHLNTLTTAPELKFNGSDDEVAACFKNSTQCSGKDGKIKAEEAKEAKVEGQFWYETIPLPPIVVASSDTLPEGTCKRQLRKYLEGLKNGTMWATQMFDASAKQPYGIIDGQMRHMGSFDQCYRIDYEVRGANGFENIKGKYCLVDYKYEQRDVLGKFEGKLEYDFDPNESVWEAIREKGDFRRSPRYLLQMALCVPASCSNDDVQQALQIPFEAYGTKYNVNVKVDVHSNNCQAYHEEPEITKGAIIYSCTLLSIVVLVIVASIYDSRLITEKEKLGTSKSRKILLCFSVKRNLQTIFEVSYKHRGLDTIHLIRFFFMSLVILGHRMMQVYLNTTVNMRYLELTFNNPLATSIHNGPIIVDGFLAIGGVLTSYTLLEHFDKAKRLNFIGLTLLRFLRFSPCYALLIFFNAYLFPYLGSGPQWKSKIKLESDNCAATWWASLLYLNNYFTMDRMCIFQSWYLAVDFQCYMVGILLIYAFWKLPRRIGYSIIGVAIFISILIPFYVVYVDRIQPIFIGYPRLRTLQMDTYFIEYYVKTHLRFTPYLVGIVAGGILHDYEKGRIPRISKRWSQALFFLIVIVVSNCSLGLGFHFLNPNSPPSPFMTALYASLHRGTFGFSCCSLIVLLTIGDGLDFYHKILTPGWVQPFSRLSYSIFLIHNVLQSYHIGSVRSARTFSFQSTIWDEVPDLFFNYGIALLLSIGVEGPFRRLEKIIFAKMSKRTPDSPTNNEKIDKNANSLKTIDELSEKLD